MVIYLRHPEHGTKVAICEAEALQDEKNGWRRFEHDVPSETEEIKEFDKTLNELDTIINKLEKKRGRPSK